MIRAILLNSQASLNNFKEITSISYVPGENVTIVVRIENAELDIRYIPPAAAVVTLEIINADNTSLTKTATELDAGDRSIWVFNLTAAESAALGGSNILINVDREGDGTDVAKAVIQNALVRNILSGDC